MNINNKNGQDNSNIRQTIASVLTKSQKGSQFTNNR